MNKPDDSELERYLAGDHPVSAQYRDAADDAPPPALDAAIRQQAHEAVSNPSPNHRRRWLRPVAAAAVLVLGVGLVFELQRQPEVRQAATPASSGRAELAAPKQSRGDAAPALRTAPAPEAAAESRFKALVEPQLQAPADRVQVQQPVEKQIDHILQLLENGQHDAAVAALKRLAERHPDVVLPIQLAPLAADAELEP